MFSKILVPLDGSKMAEETLCQVEELAKTHQGMIMLLRVANFRPFPGSENKKLERAAVERSEAYLEKVASDLIGKGLEVSTHVRFGEAAPEILEHAEKHATITVMTTHGRGGMLRWALGSVADRVIRRSQKPVLVIRPEEACEI